MTPINLNKARKEADRTKSKAQADENAIKFGQTKAQRILNAARSAQMNDRLSHHKFEEE